LERREENHLKGEVRVDQSENFPTILVSSGGWALAGKDTISSEDTRVTWNFKVLTTGENSVLEKHHIVLIRRKKGTEFGTRRGHLSSIEECEGNSGGYD